MKLIAIVEDDQDLLELISLNLVKEGYSTLKFSDPNDFLKNINKQIPDLIILDIMLPGLDGFELCKNIRNNLNTKNIPIIFITAKSSEIDKVLGLEIGADDYITKPFSIRELIARIKAILRRSNTDLIEKKLIKIDKLTINHDEMNVYVNNKKIDLTLTEYKILTLLASKPGKVFSREDILSSIWGKDTYIFERTIDVHIKKLRDKLGIAKHLIKNIRGVGYKIELNHLNE